MKTILGFHRFATHFVRQFLLRFSSSTRIFRDPLKGLIRELRRKEIQDSSVLKAIKMIPRHIFIPESYREQTYFDIALPIENKQTISQPYIVVLMAENLKKREN